MSRQNVDLVRSVLEPFGEIDVAAVDWCAEGIRETIERAHAPDVELRTLELGTGSGVGAIYRGCAGLVEYLREWLERFSASGARGEIELTTVYEQPTARRSASNDDGPRGRK